MILTNKTLNGMACGLLATTLLAACTSTEDTPNSGSDESQTGRFVFATTVQGSNATSNLLLTSEDVASGELSTVSNGLLNDGATQWVFHRDRLYALTYNQGNAGTTRSFVLDQNGAMIQRDNEYRISRFTSYGTYGDDIITTSTGDGLSTLADANGFVPKSLLVTYLNVVDETSRSNSSAGMENYVVENYLGNGEYVTLTGILQNGSRIFSGIAPMGLSRYGSAAEGGKWIRPGFEHLVHTEDGGTNSGAYKKGELTGTQYPDECWVAIYSDASFQKPVLAKTDRISTPAGRFKSQYYQTVWSADNGDVYVFSPSYAKIMTDPKQQTTLPAGVCRIPAGSSQFDDYYCNLEALTPDGKRSFMRCWPAGGNKFLLLMYDAPLTGANQSATQLAIFDAPAKKLTYVAGLPQNVSSIGNSNLVRDGKVYIPVNVTGENPAIYAIDTATAQAVRGVSVQATTISGFGFLNSVK